AEPVTVGEPELAAGFLDDLRELTRNRAEKAVTGIDDFIRGVLRALWGRRALVLRACGLSDRGIARRRRIGLGYQGRTCQAEQEKGKSDGPHHSAHRILHWKWRIDRGREGSVYPARLTWSLRLLPTAGRAKLLRRLFKDMVLQIRQARPGLWDRL